MERNRELQPQTILPRPDLQRLLRGLGALALTAAVAAGCGARPEEAATGADGGQPRQAAAAARETAATARRSYTVLGIVRQLPDPGDPSQQLLIHHAPIPDYVNSEGYETGMPSMTMPFFPAPGVELSGLAVGDRVEFTFQVDREATPSVQLTAIRPAEETPASAP